MKKRSVADPMSSLVHNQLPRKNQSDWQYGLLAALLTIVAAILIYSLAGRLIGGDYVFLHSDLYVQYVDAIRLFLRSLFGEGKVAYSFSFSMGSSTVPIYAFWCMSPWNLLFLFIPDLNIATFAVVTGKMATAAWLFQWFQSYVLKNKGIPTVAFAILYALCGYSVTYYYNIHTLDGIYILPLLMILLYRMVKTKKMAGLIGIYAYSFVVMFYTGYILGVFSAIVFILLLWKQYGRDLKNYIKPIIRYMICVLTAAAISAAVLFPTALYLFRNRAQDATMLEGVHLSILDIYQNLFIGQMQTTDGIYPMVYCGIVVLLMVPMFFYDKENDRHNKIMAAVLIAFLVLCSLWTPAYLFMHCFDAPDSSGFRFAYLISFVLLTMACVEWNRIKQIPMHRLLILSLFNAFAYYIIFLMQRNYLADELQSSSILGLEINLIFLVLILLSVKYLLRSEKKEQLGQKVFLAIVVMEVILNGYFCVTRIGYSVGESKEIYQLWSEEANQAMEQLPKESFYRVHYINPIGANDSALYGYRSIGYFSTFENVTLRNSMEALGYMTSPRTILDYGSTQLTRMLFAQEYVIRATDLRVEERRTDQRITQDNFVLGLGYMVSESLLDYTPTGDNAFEHLNQLISDMTGEDLQCYQPVRTPITMEEENMLIVQNEGYATVSMEDPTQDNAMLTFLMEATPGCNTYAYFSQPYALKDATSARTLSEGGDYGSLMTHSYLSSPHIIYVGANESGMDAVTILMGVNTVKTQTFQNAYFYQDNPELLQAAYDCLKDAQMQITAMEDDEIVANVTATQQKPLLFTSIPYEQGWHVYVDGSEVQIQPTIQQAFISVMLSPGAHEVRFVFKTPGAMGGWCLTLVGLISLGICIGIDLGGKKNGKNQGIL